MPITKQTLGGLDCRIVDASAADATPDWLVVICHGYGAPGTDLVPIGGELLTMQPSLADRVRIVFPFAPVSLDEIGMPGCRAWWNLDVASLTAALSQGLLSDTSGQFSAGMAHARSMLENAVAEMCAEWNVDRSRVVLGGFSQGSMAATDVALNADVPPAALIIWSGLMASDPAWSELAAKRSRLRILHSHGRMDPLLPFPAGEHLRDVFVGAGLDVEFIAFNGMHEIGYESLHRTGELLVELIV